MTLIQTLRTILSAAAILILALTTAQKLSAQQGPPSPRTVPLETLLNPDGTYNTTTGYSGSIDAQGWRILTDERGVPRFVQDNSQAAPAFSAKPVENPDDANWDDRFGGSLNDAGVNDEIFALASDGITLYVGGSFTMAGGIEVNGIARWDGIQWKRLGTGPGTLNGVEGNVLAIAISGDIVYVGGQFTVAGAKTVGHIARWSRVSNTWAEMGEQNSQAGVSGTDLSFVNSIVVDGDDVYVGGNFTQVGSISSTIPANNVARWSQTTLGWSTLGEGDNNGVQGAVQTLAKGPAGIYVGGSFTSAGGINTSGIALWNGTEWSDVGGGINGFVNSIAVLGSKVFVGGGFDRAGDTLANNVVKWDESTKIWSPLTGFFQLYDSIAAVPANGVNNVVRSIAIRGTEVYVSGTFQTAFPGDYTLEDINTNYIARWFEGPDDQTNIWWAPLGRGIRNGTNGFINAITIYGEDLYVGGNYSSAGNQVASNIARWDGVSWFSLATGAQNTISAMVLKDNTQLYAVGAFSQPGQGISTRLAYLDGKTWLLVGGKINGNVYALATSGDYIYIGGRFTSAGSVAVSNVVRFNTQTSELSTLGTSKGVSSPDDGLSYVSSISIDGDDVYLGGLFSSAGDATAYNIVRWNSQTDSWSPLGGGINGPVLSTAIDSDGNIYAGGRYIGAGGLPAKNIAMWDGAQWNMMDTGTSDPVYKIVVNDTKVYVGGEFSKAGTIAANSIAIWDSRSEVWSSLGTGLTSHFYAAVNSIGFNGNELYVGGLFTKAGQDSASNIARWDGATWHPLGSGVDNIIQSLIVSSSDVYVSGSFTLAGNKPSSFFGIWHIPPSSVNAGNDATAGTFLTSAPNPCTVQTHISFHTARYGLVQLAIHDARGNEIARLVDKTLPAGDYEQAWMPGPLPAGLYFCTLRIGNAVRTERIVLAR